MVGAPITVAAPAPDQPSYIVGQFTLGGEYSSNPVSWHVEASEEPGVGSLFIVLDRSLLPTEQNLTLELSLLDKEGSSLYVDLLSTNLATVGTNLYGNLIEGSNEVVCVELPLFLSEYPSASILRLWRGVGEILVYESQLTLSGDDKGQEGKGETSSTVSHQGQDSSSSSVGSLSSDTSNASHPEQERSKSDDAHAAKNPDQSAHNVIYVSAERGHDSLSGFSADLAGGHGPKRTINAALAIARPGDTIWISAGVYRENVNFCGKGVNAHFRGNISVLAPESNNSRRKQ